MPAYLLPGAAVHWVAKDEAAKTALLKTKRLKNLLS